MEGDILTFYMHEECYQVTREWDDEHWEYHDAGEFRKELEEYRKAMNETKTETTVRHATDRTGQAAKADESL